MTSDSQIGASNRLSITEKIVRVFLSIITITHYRCEVDPEGEYIRKYLPQLARMPVEFIYEPWKAPESVQREAGCVLGVDYPWPIVNHEAVSKRNKDMMEELKENLRKKCKMETAQNAPSIGEDKSIIELFFGHSNY